MKLRLFDVNANAQKIVAMSRAASDVSCYQESLASESCDFWQATLPKGPYDASAGKNDYPWPKGN